jgi:hypothetical protein
MPTDTAEGLLELPSCRGSSSSEQGSIYLPEPSNVLASSQFLS